MTPVPVITGVVFPRADETANFDFYRASIPGVDADEFLGEFLSRCGGRFMPLASRHGVMTACMR